MQPRPLLRPQRRPLPRRVRGLLLAAALSSAAVAFAAAATAERPCDDAPPSAAPHAAPPLLVPADGATLHGVGARFAWTRDAGARHRLQVARDDAFADLAVDRAGIDGAEAIVALPPGDYRWRLVAEPPHGADASRGGTAACGAARRFTLRPIPASPRPEPPQLRGGALTLRWPAGAPGEAFEAELARDAAFSEVVARHAGAEPRMVVPDPPTGFLHLRLRAIDATGYAGPWGPAHAVEVPRTRWWQALPPLTMLWWLLLL